MDEFKLSFLSGLPVLRLYASDAPFSQGFASADVCVGELPAAYE
jgi:hypothetical protein